MATTPVTKPLMTKPPRAAGRRLPVWVIMGLVAAVTVLVYGALRPSSPSAFDTPAAQAPITPDNPWQPAHSLQ